MQCYQENGPSTIWARDVIDAHDQFTMEGYLALLVGQQVPYAISFKPSEAEQRLREQLRSQNRELAARGIDVREALEMVRSQGFRWPTDLFPKLCQPAPPAGEKSM